MKYEPGEVKFTLTKGKEEAKQAYARTAAGENVLEQSPYAGYG